ncbi:MAG TPA: CDP-alcohol phosphatidyltransferase family protein [Candidatus Limnocylindrales bacterium]|nr:CDP-alcohol phosphatidyltransferase family protein [Candidatus Limnocylindrales bacterium]
MSVVSPELRTRIRGIATPIALAMGKVGLTPNALTLIGFGIAIVAAVAAATQNWLIAGLLVVFGGVFDLFDGALARATGKASKLGAFMDSVFDRWGEGIIYVGIAFGCVSQFGVGAALATAALASAFMVSYARAKSEGLGFTEGTGMAAVGLAPREVRIVILTVGLILAGALGGVYFTSTGALALSAALGLITLLGTITVIQRIVHVLRQPPPEENQ